MIGFREKGCENLLCNQKKPNLLNEWKFEVG